MDKKTIRKLEPKYTGNTRHLTEGEAAGIMAEAERLGRDEGADDFPIPVLGNRNDE